MYIVCILRFLPVVPLLGVAAYGFCLICLAVRLYYSRLSWIFVKYVGRLWTTEEFIKFCR